MSADRNTDTLDSAGRVVRHIGPSTAWRKTYDAQGRETEYVRDDGQKAHTTYDEHGAASVEWDPPLPGTDEP